MLRSLLCTSILGLTAACASTPGARPQDMSIAQHEREGQSQATAADAAHSNPDAARSTPHAAQYDREAAGSEPSWTSIVTPTEDSVRAAEEHRRQAADHRAASASLREAEGRACTGISQSNRDMSPFEHVDDITNVAPLMEPTGDESGGQRMVGATVTFRAVPGMTAEWVQREVNCHIARNASLGNVVPEMPNCPLVPKSVQARVTSTGNGFAVSIRSDKESTAQEILARAKRLHPASISSAVTNK